MMFDYSFEDKYYHKWLLRHAEDCPCKTVTEQHFGFCLCPLLLHEGEIKDLPRPWSYFHTGSLSAHMLIYVKRATCTCVCVSV